MNVTIRAMRVGDAEAVAAIAESLPQAPQWSRAAYVQALDPAGSPPRIVLVAECAGRVAGFAVASLVLPLAELESIAVGAELQGRGLGKLLLAGVIEQATVAGAGEILLEVRESNLLALRLYRGAGFEEGGHRRDYYHHPVENAVLMWCKLPRARIS